jgi:hypothetical protein
LNDEVKEKYFIKRTRPRKGGKPLWSLRIFPNYL